MEGHAWLPVELAMDGVEWMEIQAMKAGLRDRDAKEIDDIFAKRVARAEGQTRGVDQGCASCGRLWWISRG